MAAEATAEAAPAVTRGLEPAANARKRFVMELEFVQCLANPKYLQFLANERLYEDPRFIAYLDYLQYWATPPYAKYIRYPQSLYFLKLLQDAKFRKYVQDLWFQQVNHWWYYYNNRRKNFPAEAPGVTEGASSAASTLVASASGPSVVSGPAVPATAPAAATK